MEVNTDPYDAARNRINVGDAVVAAFREQNIATLRAGRVTDTGFGFEPNVVRQADTERVPVIWVDWSLTTHDYLPQRPTKIAARKCLRVGV